MASVETSLEVAVPVQDAYARWTQLETFPSFMDSIEDVEQERDTVVRFTGRVAGRKHTCTASS